MSWHISESQQKKKMFVTLFSGRFHTSSDALVLHLHTIQTATSSSGGLLEDTEGKTPAIGQSNFTKKIGINYWSKMQYANTY